jgi:D-alanyl-D-alanine carboxypeptidase (penicillin-binding protein 5/6)
MRRIRKVAAALPALLVALFPALAAAVAPPLPSPPAVDARSYILVDHASGQMLAGLNPDQRVEPASITKLMTAYVVFRAIADRRLALTDTATISERAWRSEGSRSFVQLGAQVPVEVLLKGMIVQSGNDATVALAEKVGGTEDGFAQMMNAYAKQLGMKGSSFANSTGLPDPGLYTTPRDVATLSRALIREFPQYYAWYSLRDFEWNGIRQQNRNGLLGRDPSVDGIKTGHTESAGYCLATSAQRQGTRLVSAVFGSKSMRAREDASAALLNYGFTFFEAAAFKKRGETVLTARVYKGADELVPAVPARDVVATVRRGTAQALTTRATLRDEALVAPVPAGKVLGEYLVLDGTRVVARVPLVAGKPVAEGGLWRRLSDTVALWFR